MKVLLTDRDVEIMRYIENKRRGMARWSEIKKELGIPNTSLAKSLKRLKKLRFVEGINGSYFVTSVGRTVLFELLSKEVKEWEK